jgi:hypothetical protein
MDLFADVPTLRKFRQHAQANRDCLTTQEAFRRVSDLVAGLPRVSRDGSGPAAELQELVHLKARCSAVEQATRIIWACAAATDHIVPPKWSNIPDFNAALRYFDSLTDLELMHETEKHRISWERRILTDQT